MVVSTLILKNQNGIQQSQQHEYLPFPIIKNIFDFYFNNEVHYRISQLGRLSDRFLYHKLAPIAQLSHRYFDLVSERYVVRCIRKQLHRNTSIFALSIFEVGWRWEVPGLVVPDEFAVV
ncbi:hypothetical protein PPL_04324 [Heterostelium album PN500]|uniref:Uncharacterized protein n=1 Tax=Heterostelium pallidum (strain ATCC 26659 / Pp 5 / PN500) TaxID=670386 RepID=D3B789_HETP5|nr:hypothetical protein PPL_04324 [Heterostelium album PN500]EFA82632.1 hypothetical protein PPL_04324 [Heterostelium album PN500]|eukprot:XP_020434749.1 hypothetical protein PPL_04324 [Heterostelium album PN500]